MERLPMQKGGEGPVVKDTRNGLWYKLFIQHYPTLRWVARQVDVPTGKYVGKGVRGMYDEDWPYLEEFRV